MKLIELLELAASGKKFRLKTWDNGAYVYYDKRMDLCIDENGVTFLLTLKYPENWEIYEEQKPRVKLYKFALKNADSWTDTANFYRDEAHALSILGAGRKYHKIESSMIEVDE